MLLLASVIPVLRERCLSLGVGVVDGAREERVREYIGSRGFLVLREVVLAC